jgi:mono/diheme cytochrome c family protein
MSRTGLNVVLLLALLGLGAVAWTVRSDPTAPNYVLFPNMYYSVPYDAYAANPNFPDGKTLREPVAGTIPRGFQPVRYGTGAEEAVRAGEELQNPYGVEDQAALARGAVVYGRYCAVCHGPNGKGDGPVAMKGFPPPPAFTDAKALKRKDGELFHFITFGGRNMPSYATQVRQEDRWKAILYIRELQKREMAAAAAPPK